ncbi:glycosyltransferase family 4 protein [Belliella pelovolcani]|uniref:glycosyltransferase family 4 protein n=1 Tax=Belliella pelovolcani TaxID=529505 RepID=UPI003918E181
MKIIYIHQYFLTPEEGGAVRSYHLAKGMVAAGIAVDMITAHNKDYYDLRIIDGVRVHYLPVSYKQEWGFAKRSLSFLKFVAQAKKLIKKLPRPDYLYVSSTPLTTGLLGLWAKRKFAIPYFFEIRDLWPDAPIEVGAIRNPIFKKLLYQFEKRIYKHALKCIALSPGIANAVRARTNTPIAIVPNFSDTAFFQPTSEKDSLLLEQLGLKDQLTILYAGAIGQVNAVGELLDLAKLALEERRPYQFLVVGKGSHQRALLEKAADLGLKNFRFFDFGNKEKVRMLLDISDMAFISFEHLPVLKTNSPNKFFDALAAGKAILVNHKGWVYDLTKKYQLGIFHHSKSPEKTLAKIDQMLAENTLPLYQRNARKLAEEHFTKEMAIKRLLSAIDANQFGNEITDEVYILSA